MSIVGSLFASLAKGCKLAVEVDGEVARSKEAGAGDGPIFFSGWSGPPPMRHAISEPAMPRIPIAVYSGSQRGQAVTALVIRPDGTFQAIYKDALRPVLEALGGYSIRRASNVEPSGREWIADLAPVGGGQLGPFPLRETALAAEVSWLEEHHLGIRDAAKP